MKKIKNLSLVLVAIFVVSCASEDEKMTRYLVGNWETVYVKLEMPTFKRKDTLIEYDIDFANPHDPRAKQQGKSFTTYNVDGTFESWTKKNGYPAGQKTQGNWKATKDSLFYEFSQGPGKKPFTVAFELEKIEDGFSIKGLQDRDNDGEQDDTFYLETVRLPDTEK
ncbi:hypothetical protein [Flavicella marina]|uniref:hypothetical protein n=1 Tax=Flavicella marina TaxID=1475951 RepID=UPI00126409F4|nr:hypothetical protein [Flavicella marina]